GADIAVLQLNAPLPLDGVSMRAIRTLTPVVSAAGFDAPGVVARVTGWGTLFSGGPSPEQLQSVEVPIISLAEAQRAYGRLTSDQLPAGVARGGRDSCQGDSGGPLVVGGPDGEPWLAGIVSWGIGCGDPGRPGMYARVSSFEAFLRDTTGIDAQAAPTDPTPPATDDPTPGPVNPPMDNGLTPLAEGAIEFFGPFDLQTGERLNAVLRGQGDPDLYMAFGRRPSPRDFDCRSWSQGPNESCSLEAQRPSQVFVAVFGYRDSAYALDTQLTAPAAPAPTTQPVTVRGSGSLRTGQRLGYQPLRAAPGTRFTAALTGSGDADLFVRVGAAPTDRVFDCRPFLNGSNETCTIDVPNNASEVFISLDGARAANFNIEVTYTPAQ
ncbi:MAG: trypsin-like serine protease, partial [Myxococcota bacterium]